MMALRAILFAVGIALFGITAVAQIGASGYFAQCQSLYQKGSTDGALSVCQLALAANKDHVPSLKLLARIFLERNQANEALGYLEQAQTLSTGDGEMQYLKARAYLLLGKAKEALAELPNLNTTEVLLVRAGALEQLGRYEEAFAAFQQIPTSRDARLGVARLAERLGHTQTAIGWLGNSPKELLAKARLLWLDGQTAAAARALEEVLPQLGPLESDYTKTLGLLANVYYGLGDFDKGGLVLRQLSSRTSLPTALLSKIWPWMLAFLIYLGLVLYGESRIEPMRTIEMSNERKYGPGSIYIWIIMALLVGGLVALVVGQSLYQNLLGLFTPMQGNVLRPIFYFVMGAVAILIVMQTSGRAGLAGVLGSRQTWAEGVWAGGVLLVILGIYSVLARSLGLSGLTLTYPVFFGLAFLEIAIRGMGSQLFKERYKELATYMVPLVFSLLIPGPTLFFLLASGFLGWLQQRTKGVGAGAVAWVVMGLILAAIGQLPPVRTLLGV